MELIIATNTDIGNKPTLLTCEYILNNRKVCVCWTYSDEVDKEDLLDCLYEYIYHFKGLFLDDYNNDNNIVDIKDYKIIMFKVNIQSIETLIKRSQIYEKIDVIKDMFQ